MRGHHSRVSSRPVSFRRGRLFGGGAGKEVDLILCGEWVARTARLADRAADDAEDLECQQGRARNEDALGVRVGVGRRDGDAVFVQLQQVVGNDAFEDFFVAQREANPQAVGFRSGSEDLALVWIGVVLKVAHEGDGADLLVGDDLELGGTVEELDAVGPEEGLQAGVAVNQAFIGTANTDLLCG